MVITLILNDVHPFSIGKTSDIWWDPAIRCFREATQESQIAVATSNEPRMPSKMLSGAAGGDAGC